MRYEIIYESTESVTKSKHAVREGSSAAKVGDKFKDEMPFGLPRKWAVANAKLESFDGGKDDWALFTSGDGDDRRQVIYVRAMA